MKSQSPKTEDFDLEQRKLEIKKLEIEVQELSKPQWKKNIEFFVSIFQGLAIVLGVLFTLREFVFKSTEHDILRKKSTIEYIEKKDNDDRIKRGYSFLYSLSSVIHDTRMVEKENFRDSVIGFINDSLVIKTRELANFWNVIYNGVDEKIFDGDYCRILLHGDNLRVVEMLDDIQTELWRNRNDHWADEYSDQFKGLIEYYRLINKGKIRKKFVPNPTYHGDAYPMPWQDSARKIILITKDTVSQLD